MIGYLRRWMTIDDVAGLSEITSCWKGELLDSGDNAVITMTILGVLYANL